MPLVRVRRHVAAAAVLLAALVGLSGAGTAVAAGATAAPTTAPTTAPPAAASPSPSPALCLLCGSPSPSPTPVATATAAVTRAAARPPSPTPTATRHRVRNTTAPAPPRASTAPDTSTAPPVTGSVDLGGLAAVTSAPTPSPLAVKKAASASTASRLARLGGLVLGAAVLLGLAGALGLYLTRHRHDH